jgi:hypothetical protein
MLYPIQPFSFVVAAVVPVHLSEIAPEVLFVCSFIDVPACPCEYAISMLFILYILSLVFVAGPRAFFPHSVTLSQSVSKTPLEVTAVCPIILSVPVRFPFGVLSFV